ncbi:MAG: hypothetical protein Q7U75_19365, partial [Desulfobacterales bacterium]|nr:hypothetical protein [Desulfobacterales bacterium]
MPGTDQQWSELQTQLFDLKRRNAALTTKNEHLDKAVQEWRRSAGSHDQSALLYALHCTQANFDV